MVINCNICGRIWHFYVVAALYGVFVNGITLFSVGMLLRRLGIKAGGTASGFAFSAAGVFSFFFLPWLQKTVSAFGWRWGYRMQAAVGVVILAAALLIMPAPSPDNAAKSRSVSFIPLLKNRPTIYTAAALLIANAVNLALFNHSAAMLSAAGLSAASAAAVTSRAALFSSLSKPLFGVSADRLGLKTASAVLSSSLLLASAAALLLHRSPFALAAFPLLLSVCACCNSIPANLFAAKLYSDGDFSAAASIFTFASTAGSAIGPPAAGAAFDRLGSYAPTWYLCAFASALSGSLLILSVNHGKKGK